MRSQSWPGDLEHSKNFAASKHSKALKRKDKRYNPTRWRQVQFIQNQSRARAVDAPKIFSILTNTDAVAAYFDTVRYSQQHREFIRLNLAEIGYTDLPTVSLLMAHMFDTRLPWGYLLVTTPKEEQPKEIFKKVKFHESVMNKNSDSTHFLSRRDVAVNEAHTLSILERASKFYGGKKTTELNPILTEIFSNTNNHADRNEVGVVPWLITMAENEEEKSIEFCVIDLGIGIYDSLTYKGEEISRSLIAAAVEAVAKFFRSSQNETLCENIPDGLLSTTKLTYRGQGIKEIFDKVTKGPFNNFEIITNLARVDLLNIRAIRDDSLYNFRGTLYHWTLKYES